jgi:hypothetical protein
MWLLAIEAMGAFFLFAFIVWWTMFSGKKSQRHNNQKKSKEKQ